MVPVHPERLKPLSRGTVYLKDPAVLGFIRRYLKENLRGPYLEIGPGRGDITREIPDPKTLVECDFRHKDCLSSFSNYIHWDRIENVDPALLRDCRTVVSNLPYGGGVGILVHCVKSLPEVEAYLVILQHQVVEKILGKKSVLSHKMLHLFEVLKIRDIERESFSPVPSVRGALTLLRPKRDIDWGYVEFLNRIRHPRKKLKNNDVSTSCEKRLEDLTPQELLSQYHRSLC